MNRRDFLKLGIATGSMLSISPMQAFAQLGANKSSKRFLLFIQLDGGWDISLATDPWIKLDRPKETDMFIEYTQDQVINSGNIYLGPAASPISKFANDISIVNGVLVAENDNGHEAAMLYMASGNGQGKAAQLPFELEAISGGSPYGAVVDFNPVYLGSRKVPYAMASSLNSSVDEVDAASALKNSIHDNRTPLERAIKEVVTSEKVTTDLKKKIKELQSQNSLEPIHAIAASFFSGASTFGIQRMFAQNGNLDSHSDHPKTHLSSLTSMFQKIADMFDLFKSIPYETSSLFDHTLFVITSEFSRTPALNASSGKDHNPMTNSVLLAGAGIQKGKMINSSLLIPAADSATGMSYHMASPFDYSTGQSATSKKGANFIYPENLIATLATAVGADMNKFASVPKGTPIIPGLVL